MGGIFGSVAGGETTDTATDSNPLSSSTTAVVYIADELSGSAINTNYGYRTIGSTAWVTGSGSSISLTADVGDEYEIAVSPDNTTTYGSLSTIKIPKGYSPKFTVKVGTIATPATVKKVIKNTDSAVNSVTNPENMAGSDKSTFLFTVTGEYNKYQGSSFGGTSIMSCKYNTSAFNKILVQDSNGVTYSTTGVSSPPTLTGASGFTYSAFAMPSIASNSQLNGQLYVEAGSTAPDANTGNITCFIEDAQLFYNSDTNLYEYGVVDEGNSGLGQTATQTNFTLYISWCVMDWTYNLVGDHHSPLFLSYLTS